MSVVLPDRQRSWIGKAHLVGASVEPIYFRPGTLHEDNGTIHHLPRGSCDAEDDHEGDEWVLINSTPASCVQIGLFHYFQDRGPVDVVVSGPNYGRNTTTLFALSSGTIGGALEAATCGKRAIALSYAFSSRNHDPVIIAEASRHSVRLIEYLCENWADDVQLYNVNLPLEPGVSKNRVVYADMLENQWSSGSCFQAVDAAASVDNPNLEEKKLRDQGEKNGVTTDLFTERNPARRPLLQHKHFKWAPSFADVYKSVSESAPGNDGWAVKQGMTRFVSLDSLLFGKDICSREFRLVSPLSGRTSCTHPVSKGRSCCEWSEAEILYTSGLCLNV